MSSTLNQSVQRQGSHSRGESAVGIPFVPGRAWALGRIDWRANLLQRKESVL